MLGPEDEERAGPTTSREQIEAKDLLSAYGLRTKPGGVREAFARRYRPWYPKAVDVLEDDC